ncbi:MAG: family 15 glucoamylase, partial [Nitrososphaeria archaeon]|nr:family 15 glucoamylase [Nitrososphaeria archaeon]
HYRNYEKALRISKSRGFARVNSQDWYDRKEWIFIDFRIASSLNKFGLKKDADKILNWVIKKIKENNYLIPELLDEKASTYQGAVPMVGFGAASYINYLFERK